MNMFTSDGYERSVYALTSASKDRQCRGEHFVRVGLRL